MNIIFICIGQFPDGAAHTIRLLGYAKAIKLLRGKAHFLLLDEQQNFKQDVTTRELRPNITFEEVLPVDNIIMPGLFWGVKKTIATKNKLKERLEILRQSYDIIHFYGITGNSLPNAWIINKIAKKHKYYIFYEQTEFPFLRRYKSNKILYYLYKYTYKLLLQDIHGIIVISQKLKEHYVCQIRTDLPIAVINMFVDPERFEIISPKPKISTPYIAYAGTMSGDKDGVPDLIKAFEHVNIKHPDWKLVLLGDPPKAAKANNMNIIFTGRVPGNQIVQYLNNASILALARPDNIKAAYGVPTKVGEYLATGNPIVLTKVGELANCLKHQTHCFFVQPNNPCEFGKVLVEVIDNYAEAKQVGYAGKRLTKDVFNNICQTKRMLEFMNKAVSTNNPFE